MCRQGVSRELCGVVVINCCIQNLLSYGICYDSQIEKSGKKLIYLTWKPDRHLIDIAKKRPASFNKRNWRTAKIANVVISMESKSKNTEIPLNNPPHCVPF